MAIKGQKFKSYTKDLKMEAIRLHIEDKWTYRQITEHLGIQDKDRYVQQLERENRTLKKCLEIWMREVRK